MLKEGSGEDGYLGNWARSCDIYQAVACTLYYHTESVYLCNGCDKQIHAANPMICTACENAPAIVTCSAEAASFCINCDIQIHSVNPLARRHTKVPIPSFSSLASSSSSTHKNYQLPRPMFGTRNKIEAPTLLHKEIKEDETDSWLLLEPDSTDNQTMSGFTYNEHFDEYMDVVDTCTKYQC
ncbi:hypothetical protein DITRI_Ditri12bG0033600 [Diplodiscus trichospermus]